MYELQDIRAAARLLDWGLHPQARPTQASEYRELLTRYTSSFPFQDLVDAIAEGLSIHILDVGPLGIAIMPAENSVFAFTSNDYRPSGTVDDHLLDGLIFIAIQTTVYPLAQDLMEDSTIARPAITVEEVDKTLRSICDRLEERSRKQPDIPVASVEERLHAAYHVYKTRAQIKTSKNGRIAPSSIFAMIDRALKFLQGQGCFLLIQRGSSKSYRPTWRFQVQVQDWSAAQLYIAVKAILTQPIKES